MKVSHNNVSLKDIAIRTGISSMTVSRVVNGTGSVKTATRLKILKAIKEMGYRKDVFASINSKKRSKIKQVRHVTINFPMAYFRENDFFSFFSTINMQIISELQALKVNYSLVHIDDKNDIKDLDTILNTDAVIYCGRRAAKSYEAIKDLNPKAKHVCICFNQEGVSCVNPDDAEGGKLAAKYFNNLGHKNLVCLTIDEDVSICERSISFKSAMNVLNPSSTVDILKYSISKGNAIASSITNVLDDYLNNHQATGIFVPNGYDTMVVYKFLKDRGIKIPEEIGLLGYDDLEFYNYIDIPLSRIVFPKKAIGEMAVTIVKDLLEGRLANSVKSLIPVKLIDKKSVIQINQMTKKEFKN